MSNGIGIGRSPAASARDNPPPEQNRHGGRFVADRRKENTRMTTTDEPTTNPEEHIADLAEELLRRLDVLSNGDLRGEISLAQYRMLSVIHNSGPLSVGRTAHLIGSAQSTTSELMSRLLKAGLVSKVRGPYDGRVVMVELTDPGRQALKQGRKRIRESYQALYAKLPDAERGAFVGALKQLTGLMGKTEDSAL
jgi:DNA-binding MarR family transcriptional regulator